MSLFTRLASLKRNLFDIANAPIPISTPNSAPTPIFSTDENRADGLTPTKRAAAPKSNSAASSKSKKTSAKPALAI